MFDRIARSFGGSTLFLFGPQALSFDEDAFRHLRSTAMKTEDHRWILDTVAGLPNCLESIYQGCSKLMPESRSGLSLLEDLQNWFTTGTTSRAPLSLPNILLSPLVIITQLIQYTEYLKILRPSLKEGEDLYDLSAHKAETLGFCTGLLSALVVSSSTDRDSFEKFGAVAIRLGMLIGMTVDAQHEAEESGPSESLATIWRSAEEKQKMTDILGSFPEAYISVFYDENRATITTSTETAPVIQQQLRASGIIATNIALRGRFHWQGYSEDVKALIKFCDSNEKFQFPNASALVLPHRSSAGGDYVTRGQLTSEAVRSILLEPPQWYETFCKIQDSSLREKNSNVILFGLERCIPPSLLRELNQQVVYMADFDRRAGISALKGPEPNLDNDIAVVGMSCKVAGADDLEEFWKLLCDGKSQHKEVPSERFTFETVHRELDPQRKWYGNFMRDHDRFDHKFFKKAPREVASMDPQQRQILQIAYQAVQQSGYFRSPNPDRRVGCYVGVCSTDYEDNIACHHPTAYSATGHLRGFIAGKVSHFFGWTGPGLTIDTACSSSAVAVHQACRAILGGECTAAIAGGTHVMTSPLWYQNLAQASFLSKTGACKPFDADADGYCRGEGAAAVFLKKLSAAIADGDHIIGVIAGTAVQQNQNCTPIVVPNVPSLSELFENVLEKARLKPEQITVVEAHGTGTPVGDPAEYESVRQVFGGYKRASPLELGSVKGLVGHCECVSGLVSLVKILLMIQEGGIPPQASFKTLNPTINLSPADQIHISTSLIPWKAEFRAALINNYGASGSNASMVITEAPDARMRRKSSISTKLVKSPFWFSGLDDRSLRAYVAVLRKHLRRKRDSGNDISLPNLAFNLSRQSNRSLGYRLLLSCHSIDDLDQQLSAYENGESAPSSLDQAEPRPLVLCFGGQVSKYVGLDRHLYDKVTIFRNYLNQCNSHCVSLEIGSIFPTIFQRTPVEDPLRLQICLFALQYSCAKSWMDSGAQPAAVIGHSFGELTSLCVAQVLSLKDALKMVAARARIIRESWGHERGAMMAVEADLNVLQQLLIEANQTCFGHEPAVIACYNSPNTFTLAGSNHAIDAIGDIVRNNSFFSSIKTKKLNVTHAFHSTLVDPLMDGLKTGNKDLTFGEPSINMARCTEYACEESITPKYFADHMRLPVFFNNSIQRLTKQFPHCIWLEAGSNSTITNMASRALSSPSGNHFQSVNITNDNAWENLTDATLNLWRAGVDVSFWPHHNTQMCSYEPSLLPPYQFEPAHHWLELKKPPQKDAPSPVQVETQIEKLPETLVTFMGYQDKEKLRVRFRVNTMIPEYEKLMMGHVVAYTAPICPATVQIDLAIECVRGLLPPKSQLQPQIQGMQNEAPICINKSLIVWLDLEATSDEKTSWNFRISSTNPQKKTVNITHTKGLILIRSPDDLQTKLDFARYERLTGHGRCTELLNRLDASDSIQGRSIYKIFSEVVDYGEQYQGLEKVVGKGQESAGRVIKKYNPKTWFDAHLSDNFCQVVGIWINCMTDRAPTNLYIAKGVERWVRSPKLDQQTIRPETYDVLAYHQGSLESGFTTDIFVFHPSTGELLEVVLGIEFVKVAKSSLVKLLSRLTHEDDLQIPPPSKSSDVNVPQDIHVPKDIDTKAKDMPEVHGIKPVKAPKAKKKHQFDLRADVLLKLRLIMVELSGVELEQITEHTELADIGIDSLMGMELVSEIESKFKCSLSEDEIAHVTDVSGVLRCVQAVLSPDDGTSELADSKEDNFDSASDSSTISTPSEADTQTSIDELELESNRSLKSVPTDNAIANSVSKTKFRDINSRQVNTSTSANDDLVISTSIIFEAFKETKSLTDQFIADGGCSDYCETVLARQNNLCVSLTLAAFEQMGCNLRSARAGEEVKLFKPLPEHVQLIPNLCKMLEKVARLIKVDGSTITRTDVAYPTVSGEEIMHDLLKMNPNHRNVNNLIFYVGSNLADALSGKIDGVKLIFGCQEGRELVSGLYGDWVMNRPCYRQMEDFLSRLVSSLSSTDGPIKIMEMGSGTGGTTKWLVPLLASLNHPVEYTFTDLAPSFVAAARKKFKQYSFMKFRTHDIEKEPAQDLLNKHHIVIASNAIHATHSLISSLTNVKKALLPNGVLMMLEMIEPLYWIDMIFGLFEGWWLFDDGRTHALTPVSRWKTDLQSAGFGHVDWTDGVREETKVNKVIIAVACDQGLEAGVGLFEPLDSPPIDNADRQSVIDNYVRKNTHDFAAPAPSAEILDAQGICVLVTGATGSIGSHLIANLTNLAGVKTIICLNRRSNQNPKERQLEAFVSKGIVVAREGLAKLQVLESDTTKPKLGLTENVYQDLVKSVTHIVHNAWIMSIKRPLKGFESQFYAMRNLINLARDVSSKRPQGIKVNFQFISSIAVVGQYPVWKNEKNVPEERMPIEAILPIGYADAKYICELMLDKTLHQYPDQFRTSAVRIGQIAGSKISGYWNPFEHLSFLWKSSQTLNKLPSLPGLLSWTPVDDVAETLVDLAFVDDPYPIYNIDNPVRQQWQDMLPVLADVLDIPRDNIIPFEEWVDLVRNSPDVVEKDNPASKLIDFLDSNFLRMSCGGLLLETTKAREHSKTLRAVGPVSADVTRKFVEYWKKTGFLS
ncbi:hypothetical protein MMC17_002077 [Xylographa soralifera]|nr:hypothetical protein [Xylographa soralifera]